VVDETTMAVPPLHLMQRVALRPAAAAEMQAEFIAGGRLRHDTLCAALPAGWSFSGRSVLDFGCGPGRLLRHFQPEAASAQFHGCDIDAESIEWLGAHLVPPFKLFVNDEKPPLALDDRSFDLIYATSVFTHLTDLWGHWLVELHRLLKDDGLLFMTFLSSAGFADQYIHESWSNDDIGLTMLGIMPDAEGGSRVLISDWWIRTHLSRGFQLVDAKLDGWGRLPDRRGRGQGMLLLRRKPGDLSVAELLAPEPDEPREWSSAQFNLKLLRREILNLRAAEREVAKSGLPGQRSSERQRLVRRFRRFVR
jgi:SAM-dependent methyltransferase